MPKNLGENRIDIATIARIKPKDAERLSRYLVRPGDIVYSRRGDVTKRAIADAGHAGWLCGTGCLRVRFGGDEVLPRFGFYYLGHPVVREWISRHAIGATLPNLNTSILSALPFVVPPRAEQEAIVAVLGALDDKIGLNRRMNETLEAMARAIFKSWFVDFDPVRAKAEGRQPFGIDTETAALFPNSFQDSPLGRVPKGWGIEKLDQVVEIIGGGTPKTTAPEYWGGDIPWFSVVDAPRPSDVFIIDTEKRITKPGLDNSSARVLPERTTIISARGTVGRLALVGTPMAMNQSCYGVRPRGRHGEYFTYFLMRDRIRELSQSTHGTVFDTITRDTFKIVHTVTPPEDLTLRFDAVAQPLMERMPLNLMESKTLAATRDALLPKLISGEIRVKDAERIMGKVM
jgi:type I restriction enzyme S subunit